jgi:restriction system protein
VLSIAKAFKRCEHHIVGGLTRKRCSACVAALEREEQRKREEARRREEANRQRRAAEDHRRKEIARLWSTGVPRLDELRKLHPRKFETLVAAMFERIGYQAVPTSYSKDGGKDIVLYRNDAKYLVECKRYASDSFVGRPELQKFHSAIVTDEAACGFFVTTGRVSKDAIEFADKVGIELLYGKALRQFMYRGADRNIDSDSYTDLCPECGLVITRSIQSKLPFDCMDGHKLLDALTLERVIAECAVTGEPPNCPKCRRKMRYRKGSRGPFWGCANFPRCDGSRSI